MGSAWRAWVGLAISLMWSEGSPVRMLPAYREYAKPGGNTRSKHHVKQGILVFFGYCIFLCTGSSFAYCYLTSRPLVWRWSEYHENKNQEQTISLKVPVRS